MEMLLDQAPTRDLARLARLHMAANLKALAATQPDLAAPELPNVTWLFARDGALTAMLEGDRWWGNCSVPLAAARFMLRTMDIRGTLGCFLNPMHAAQLRVALDLLHPRQGVVAIVPDPQVLAVLLHGHDFSRDIVAGRLWFAAGPQWENALQGIFQQNPGLPTPVEFIRPILADCEPADRLIAPAQAVFAEAGVNRGHKVQSLLGEWRPRRAGAPRVCLLAGSDFRLWDDAPLVLAGLDWDGAGLQIERVDSDRPASASPLGLAQCAVSCDAVVAANYFRCDLAGVTPSEQPWVTWVTSPRIPAAGDVGPNDRLVLADPGLQPVARQKGWDDARVCVAGWPSLVAGQPSPGSSVLALVADTHSIEAPKQIAEYSSQVLLWNMIRDELIEDPFLAVEDIAGYLCSRRARLQIGAAGFDSGLFADRLIAPAIQQGLAALLIREGLPVRLFGRGWDRIERFAPHVAGTISSRAELAQVLIGSAAMVHVWPWQTGHPAETAGRAVVRGQCARDFLRAARAAAAGALSAPPMTASPSMSVRAVSGLLHPTHG